MKYQVTYRLLHPAYIPVTRTSPINAATRAGMLARLAGLIDKWRGDGYTVYVLNIAPMRAKQRRRVRDGDG